MKRGIWSTHWFTGLAYGLVFLLIAYVIFPTAFTRLETVAYDLGVGMASSTPGHQIAVIAIDDASINQLGRWPWPRDYHADLIDRLNRDHARVIATTVLLSEQQLDLGSVYIRSMLDFYDHCSVLGAATAPAVVPSATTRATPAAASSCAPDSVLPTPGETFKTPAPVKQALLSLHQKMQDAEQTLDVDTKLAGSIKAAGNVVIPMVFKLGEPLGRPGEQTPDYMLRNAIGPVISTTDDQGQPLSTTAMSMPVAGFAKAASMIGFLNETPDSDGALRAEPLVLRYYNIYYPSLALSVAMKYLNLRPEDVQVMPGQGVKVGKLFIGTTPELLMRNFYYSGSDSSPPFPIYSFADVKLGKIPSTAFQDKIVLIGATATGLGDRFPTPTSSGMAPVLVIANVVSSILQQNFFTEPQWTGYLTLAALLLTIAYLAFILPRLKPGPAALMSLVLLIVLLAVEFSLLENRHLWISLMVPALLLVTGHLVMTVKLSGLTSRLLVRTEADSAESSKMLGLAFQGQGQLDMAFEKFRKCPMDKSLADLLYNLALDYERKRQFNKAGSVYQHIQDFDPKFRDIAERVQRSRQLEGTVILGAGNTPAGTLIMGAEGVQKPMLGRYQVEKELGKGAMGVVYLGRDPKINRVVAIKTMALSQEFDGDELEEVKQRFFREAETAGRLNHPNIVTIYDAGEEHDLAYIAMEFLKGKDLTGHIKSSTLLPATRVMDIIVHAAEALDYAHTQNVVHRDIKPANIMYEEDSGAIKLTDFGIARITDSSKTKTGMVLGTPSYMSPEQLSGKKVDGRSDLFSLGVTLYQMLTGQLPFQADSMATLMFKIANEPHASITTLLPELPASIDAIINKALQKDPDQRYQTGAEFARDVRAVAAQTGQ
ncbi:MAG TPA: serine/threonine-protein kinase [Gammaproteobacteria bacterium]|nr:serine/threonine-protein kinase [Gammaproteobacteria bacterium]